MSDMKKVMYRVGAVLLVCAAWFNARALLFPPENEAALMLTEIAAGLVLGAAIGAFLIPWIIGGMADK